MAYKNVSHVENTLKGHRKFKEDKHRVSNLKLEILKILAIEDRLELLPVLKRALGSAANALFQLKVSCSGKPEQPVCEEGLQGLFRVTYDLVVAAMQVVQGIQLMTIHDALKLFDDSQLERKNMTLIETVEKAYAMSITVEEAI
ncbi:unnamed protein product [Nippostrongylus brasiliensis]|uniref:DSHCT domain-containing protein n=1 Tax=Nippostrongylus brasiliensis TaxID=27835 RepID=A0A0N4YKX3_NIPBR|nr:hypothetical protein Q1695_004392 [Nippostrongylus brasiliensis]VDL81378.1 unnamed protein product [Nippostrongylus brasiliensis]